MTGTWSEVLGIDSDTISRNTVNANNTEIPHEIFSPASAGIQNMTNTKTDRMRQGIITF